MSYCIVYSCTSLHNMYSVIWYPVVLYRKVQYDIVSDALFIVSPHNNPGSGLPMGPELVLAVFPLSMHHYISVIMICQTLDPRVRSVNEEHVTTCHVVSYCVMLFISYYICAILHHVVYVKSNYTYIASLSILCHATCLPHKIYLTALYSPHDATRCHAMPYHTMRCHAIRGEAMPCHTLCNTHAMLRLKAGC